MVSCMYRIVYPSNLAASCFAYFTSSLSRNQSGEKYRSYFYCLFAAPVHADSCSTSQRLAAVKEHNLTLHTPLKEPLGHRQTFLLISNCRILCTVRDKDKVRAWVRDGLTLVATGDFTVYQIFEEL